MERLSDRPAFASVLGEDSIGERDPWLPIPQRFVQLYADGFAKECRIRGPDGAAWGVTLGGPSLSRIGMRGGWETFALAYGLKAGDLLVVRLVQESVFQVEIFGSKSRVNKLPGRFMASFFNAGSREAQERDGQCLEATAVEKDGTGSAEDGRTRPRSSSQIARQTPPRRQPSQEEDGRTRRRSSSRIAASQTPPRQASHEEDGRTTRRSSSRIASQTPPPRQPSHEGDGTTRRRSSSRIPSQAPPSREEDGRTRWRSSSRIASQTPPPSRPPPPAKASTSKAVVVASTRTRKKNSEEQSEEKPLSRRRAVTDAERERALERARQFTSTNPFTMNKMNKSHVYRGFWMGMNHQFARQHLPSQICSIVLVDSSGAEWPARYLPRPGISGGWKKFALDHRLEEGDVVIFERVDRTQCNPVIRVHIYRVVEVDDLPQEEEEQARKRRKYSDSSREDLGRREDKEQGRRKGGRPRLRPSL
ncbi:B3 domain-containing transcription factor VRN1-like isoform X2 [Selaginella moellendorffii]|uniref:B3 domain-containing transcription factor VRN1-like isoform X2 n=1 Tax=Selaginella moellendorffii TaxID=88036 RepID=UPI000D1C5077|nr:B3 domain-containing transcription factor VRN1-like isoform X2 [Selaginella moellendorffii]|eukprot:XP_024539767.1 B3 domain-containing transcription factor VRN1-like isoform X2 [Selaginella moellendorffii]